MYIDYYELYVKGRDVVNEFNIFRNANKKPM